MKISTLHKYMRINTPYTKMRINILHKNMRINTLPVIQYIRINTPYTKMRINTLLKYYLSVYKCTGFYIVTFLPDLTISCCGQMVYCLKPSTDSSLKVQKNMALFSECQGYDRSGVKKVGKLLLLFEYLKLKKKRFFFKEKRTPFV